MCVNICVYVRAVCGYTDSGCVGVYGFWLCAHMFVHTHREGRFHAEVVFFPFYTATGHAYSSSSQCISTIVSLLFFFGGGGCILIFSANMHRDLSGVTSFTTKCPTAPAVIPGPSIAHRLQSPLPSLCPGRKRLCVEAPAAAVSHGSTALGFCPPLSCWSSYRNVVSWAATLLLDVNAVGQ